jgi:hypothetical protein
VRAEEGDLERVSERELRSLLAPVDFEYVSQAPMSAGKALAPQLPSSRAWRLIAFAVLAVMLAEMLLAMLFGRYRR